MPAPLILTLRPRFSILVILVVCGAFLQGCDRGSPTEPTTTPPPTVGPPSITLAVEAGNTETLAAGGGTVDLIATVADAAGSRLSGVAVTFATSSGVLSNGTVNTDASGQARTTLTTGREAIVTATTGGRTAEPLTIRVSQSERLVIRVLTAPAQPRAGVDVVTFIASVTPVPGATVQRYRWNFGDGSEVIETREDQTTHTYRQPGLKTITVVADLSDGYRLAAGRALEVR